MEKADELMTAEISRVYQFLRPVFLAGMALSLILYFVPVNEPSGDILSAWTATGGVARRLSSFDLCGLLVRTGNLGWGVFYIASSGLEFLLLLLALLRPRRWVFMVGSFEQLYFLIAFLLRPSSPDFSQPWFVVLLACASWAMGLSGFFVKPPRFPLETNTHLDSRLSHN
jgi:hypothetical protein